MQREPRSVKVIPTPKYFLNPSTSHQSPSIILVQAFFYLDHYNSSLSGFSCISWSLDLLSTQQPTWSFKTINKIMWLPSLASFKALSLHIEWNLYSLPWPMGSALAKACLLLWPHLLLSSTNTLGLQPHGLSFCFLHTVSLPAALGLLHELSPLPGMFFTQVLCMTDSDSLSFRSLCKCHFFREASWQPILGLSPSHFLSVFISNGHHCIYHYQLPCQLFICFLSPPTRRQAPWD